MIEAALLMYIRSKCIEPTKLCEDKYKIKFTVPTKRDGGVQNVDITFRILNVDSKIVAVEFLRMGGDKQMFIDQFREIRDEALSAFNDAVLA